MQTNLTKQKLQNGETVYGLMTRNLEPGMIEFLAYQGWDFFIFDGEHGTLTPERCEDLARIAELRGVTGLARVTTNQRHIILRFMDTGIQGVMVPQVNSGDEAEDAIQSIKYGPRGVRGLAGVRAATYLQTMNYTEYVETANRETLSIIQVETKESVDDIDAILAVPDVDVVFIGRTDLSQSLGFPGQANHPTVEDYVERVFKAAEGTGVHVGVLVGSAEETKRWQERGSRFIVMTTGALLASSSKAYLNAVR